MVEVRLLASIEVVALALSDPIRLRILDLLAAGRDGGACCSPKNDDSPRAICSCDILMKLRISPSRLSYHVKELKAAELISEQRRGRWIYYCLNPQALGEFIRQLGSRYMSQTPGAAGGQDWSGRR